MLALAHQHQLPFIFHKSIILFKLPRFDPHHLLFFPHFRQCKKKIEQPATFLSPYVHNILVDLPSKTSSRGYENCLTGDIFFNWKEIENILNVTDDLNIFERDSDWFESELAHVWGLIHVAGERFLGVSPEKRAEILRNVPKIVDPSEENDSAALLEATLIITAALERFLGDVYFSHCSRSVPFLLRDLLATKEMVDIFGKTPIVLSQLLVGCVLGLNVRNVVMHGFCAPHELHVHLVCSLIVLFASLNQQANSKQLNNRREPVNLKERSGPLLNFFPDLMPQEQHLREFIRTSNAINPMQRVYWERILTNFKSERYGECVVIVLPQLEQCLRAHFCPSTMLCAQPSEFYVTLDQIISPSNAADWNCGGVVADTLGMACLEMLHDAFAYMDGPRIRDKISHGEVALADIDRALCNHVLALAFTVLSALAQEDSIIDASLIATYRSRLHPACCLRRKIEASFASIQLDWPEAPGHDQTAENDDAATLKATMYGLFHFQPELSLKEAIKQIRNSLDNEYFLNLHRHNLDVVAVSEARRLVSRVQPIVERLREAFLIGRDQDGRHLVRQRQRKTFARMLASLPGLQSTVFAMLAALVLLLTKPLMFSSQLHKKLLKSGLKYVENVVSLSRKEKNRWIEIHVLTNNISNQYSRYIDKNIDHQLFAPLQAS